MNPQDIAAFRARRSAPGLGREQHLGGEVDSLPRRGLGHLLRDRVQAVRQRFKQLVRRLVVRRLDRRRELD